MAAYGAVILIIMAFILFSIGTWALNKICEKVVVWDKTHVDQLKLDAGLDTIRYAVILNKFSQDDYPNELDKNLLLNMVQKSFGAAQFIEPFEIIQYQRRQSYNGPSFKLILRNTKTNKTYTIESYQVGVQN